MREVELTDAEFAQVRAFALRAAGISLSPAKKTLVMGRWHKRLVHHGLSTYAAYLRLINAADGVAERQVSIDLLTTNETHFFREPKHFDFLRNDVLAHATPRDRFRVWSAACSSGEEPYSVAMLLADRLAHREWEVLGTDLSSRVLDDARGGLYDAVRTQGIPDEYLRRFCLKGTGPYADKVLVDRPLRERVQFRQVNLNGTLPNLGQFDVIFLRNVMIYFDTATKADVVGRLLPCLKPGGYFLIGHSDTLSGVSHELETVRAAIFRKAQA